MNLNYTQMNPAAQEPTARLGVMDEESMDEAVLYPTMNLQTINDPKLHHAINRGLNNWLAEYYVQGGGGRLHGAVNIVAVHDVEWACEEARRCVNDFGFKAIFLRPCHATEDARWWNDYYDPLFETAAELDVLADESLALAEKAKGAGVDTEYALYEGVTHGFLRAAASGDAPAGGNPCRFIKKYPTRSRDRFLSEQEYDRLGAVLDELEGAGRVFPSAAAAIRLLMLTGCRRNEILTLKWENVALEQHELRLPDTKTGARAVPLSPTARGVLATIPRQPGNPWVIFGRGPGTRLANLNVSWQLVRREAGLEDVRLHDLRHSFASRALALGESLPMIARLLGHSQMQTTARYAHLARDSVHEAACRVSDRIEAALYRDHPGFADAR
jgi:integrase